MFKNCFIGLSKIRNSLKIILGLLCAVFYFSHIFTMTVTLSFPWTLHKLKAITALPCAPSVGITDMLKCRIPTFQSQSQSISTSTTQKTIRTSSSHFSHISTLQALIPSKPSPFKSYLHSFPLMNQSYNFKSLGVSNTLRSYVTYTGLAPRKRKHKKAFKGFFKTNSGGMLFCEVFSKIPAQT
jgi:hypothetical protein